MSASISFHAPSRLRRRIRRVRFCSAVALAGGSSDGVRVDGRERVVLRASDGLGSTGGKADAVGLRGGRAVRGFALAVRGDFG